MNPLKSLRTVVTVLLAWLGLAGLSDNFVEWQSWFETGVMQHWKSVKAWISVSLFGWLPFIIPDWFWDYLVIGGIYTRSLSPDKSREPSIIVKIYGYSLFFLFWLPLQIMMLFLIISAPELRKRTAAWNEQWMMLKKVALGLIGFVPVLFVVSTLLYEFG